MGHLHWQCFCYDVAIPPMRRGLKRPDVIFGFASNFPITESRPRLLVAVGDCIRQEPTRHPYSPVSIRYFPIPVLVPLPTPGNTPPTPSNPPPPPAARSLRPSAPAALAGRSSGPTRTGGSLPAAFSPRRLAETVRAST